VGFLLCMEEDEREREAKVGVGFSSPTFTASFYSFFPFPLFFCSFTTIARFLVHISLTFSLNLG